MIAREELMFENEIVAAEKLAEILPANAVKNENFLMHKYCNSSGKNVI